MENTFWIGVLLAIFASTSLNIGKALQKWKVSVLGKGKAMFAKENRGDFTIWIIGLAMTASCSIIYSLALKYSDKSSIVSSLNGVGMIGLVLFCWLVLKEKIGFQELGGALLVLIGTTVMGYFDKVPEQGQQFYLDKFLYAAGTMLIILVPLAVLSWKTKKMHGLIFGALAGTILGMCLILGDMALVRAGNSFLGQLNYGYPYAAVLGGAFALTATQFAFWRAPAMIVIPTINAFMILSPVVLEYFTFGTVLEIPQYGGIAIITAGAVFLTYNDVQDKLVEDE
jgi:drug/metabolite transporter (DMT)-like permease